MELFLKLIKLYGAALIGYGFIFFVVLRLCNTSNFKRKALASLITGVVLISLTIVAIVIDTNKQGAIFVDFSFIEPYYVFFLASILLTSVISGIYLILGFTRHQKFAYYKAKIDASKVKVTPTIKDKKEFVYVVFSKGNNILLRKESIKGEDYYSGLSVALNKKILFHDEMIKQIMRDYDIITDDRFTSFKEIGEVLVEGKIDKHYYCYNVVVDEFNQKLNEFEEISAYDLVNYNLSELDKQILYHYILKDHFDIKLKEN